MAGIMRLVEGVVAVDSPLGVVPGTDADETFAKIDDVSIALQTETLTNNGQNQIAGAESAWGRPVTAIGVNTNWYKILEDPIFNGQPSVAVRQNGNGFRIDSNPLRAFPKSYMIIVVGAFSAEALANTTGAFMLMVGVQPSNTATKVSTRQFNGNFIFSPNTITTSVFMQIPMSTFTANTPMVLGIHWNNDTHTGRIYLNDFENPIAQNTNVSVSSPEPEVGDHWDFLYGGNGNVGGIWGNYARAFVVDSAIMDDAFGKAQMLQAIQELKSVYGIA